jgi:hypothetical protein
MLDPGKDIASGKEWSSNGVRIAFPIGVTLFFCRLGIKGGRENSIVAAQLLSQKQFNERMIDPDRFFSQSARKGSWQRSHGIFSLGRCRTRGGFLGFRDDGNAGRHIAIRRCRCVSGGHGIAKDRARRFGIVCAVHTLFQPWNCFTPFEPIDYDDPDVVSAAASFHAVGVFWIAGSFLTVICAVIAWFRAPIPESS